VTTENSRAGFAVLVIILGLTLAVAAGVQSVSAQSPATTSAGFPALPIPPILDLDAAAGRLTGTLIAAAGEHEFLQGRPSPSLGYNGSYLGPTIVLERGGSYSLRIDNRLEELTSLHWHGLDIQADADGGPRQPIEPGDQWDAVFDIHQAPATAWYHPHAMGTTAKQVALGLAGMIIIQDASTAAARDLEAALPHTYGVDDLPVIFQDRRLNGSGENSYRPAMPDIMHGYSGNTLVTNGVAQPVATVPRGLVRLRLLNGSNAAYVRAEFPDSLDAHVIASDGGYLSGPLPVESVVVAAGERYEVVVNTRDLARDEIFWIEARTDSGLTGRLLGLRVEGRRRAASPGAVTTLPDELLPPPRLVDPSADLSGIPRRRFVLETRGMMSRNQFTINGRAMDIRRIDESVEAGRLEIWEIENAGPMNVTHSFHVHSAPFQVVSYAGQPVPDLIAGRKDTVIIPPGATVEIAVRFDEHLGVFMYHCHMLEHEESGLMGQFEVVP
jgi:FtsP/CotA-like multicopper oxidase with cupredoxin domain